MLKIGCVITLVVVAKVTNPRSRYTLVIVPTVSTSCVSNRDEFNVSVTNLMLTVLLDTADLISVTNEVAVLLAPPISMRLILASRFPVVMIENQTMFKISVDRDMYSPDIWSVPALIVAIGDKLELFFNPNMFC